MKRALVGLAVASSVVLASGLPGPATAPRKCSVLPAAGYYITIRAQLNGRDEIDLLLNSNLPGGARVRIMVYKLRPDGSKATAGEGCVIIPGATHKGVFRNTYEGIAEVVLHPNKGSEFLPNMVCEATFSPYDSQLPSVLEAVGRRGQHLGTPKDNPQVAMRGGAFILDVLGVV